MCENTSPYKENRPAQSDASRVPLSQRADPVAGSDLAEVATGFDWTGELRLVFLPVSVAPATPISITIIGPSVAIAVIWASVTIAISMAVIATAIGTAIVSVVVGNLFDRRVRDGRTIQRERGHGGVGWAGTRK
jgi:hypothetical protein